MFWNNMSFGLLCRSMKKMKLNQSFKVKLNEFSISVMNVGKEAHSAPLVFTLFCFDVQ